MFRTSLLLGIIITGVLELTYRYHGKWVILSGIIIALLLYVRWWFRMRVEDENRDVVPIFVFFSLSLLCAIFFATVIEYSWLRHLFAVGVGLYYAFVADEISRLRGDIRSRPTFFVTTIITLTMMSLFFLVGFGNGVSHHLESASMVFLFLESIVLAAIVFLAFRILRVPVATIIMSLVVLVLIIIEGQWILSFLPLGIITRSLLLCIPIAVWLSIERDRVTQTVESKKLLQWGSSAIVLIFVILFTTRWS